ncbi:MAG: 23S rRNA (adenine(2030)-N(6))-methyltransferase RlmJ [Rubrivivax sp.]
MLAYRHAFHAGNHGDVLKHAVLVHALEYLNLKDKGWRFVDTHAGAGEYSLSSAVARKKAESAQGAARLWGRNDAPPLVARYLARLAAFNRSGTLRNYPGSPAIAQALQRRQDDLRLFELHPSDVRTLAARLGRRPGVEVALADGFEALKAVLPPPTRRALVLIDPSYELERDYARVVATLREALARFAEGVYVVWYPQVGRVAARELPRRLQAIAPKGWLHARLTVQQPDARGFGMAGSSVFVFNPPHTLHAALAQALPWLHENLRQFEGGSWLLDQRAV